MRLRWWLGLGQLSRRRLRLWRGNECLRARMKGERLYADTRYPYAPRTVWLIVEVPVVGVLGALLESAHRRVERVHPVSRRGTRLRVRMAVVKALEKERLDIILQ